MTDSSTKAPRRSIVVIGSGAREHALADALVREGHFLTVAPGNPCIPNSTLVAPSVENLLALGADLYVFGPERPLVDGVADKLRQRNKHVFGPDSGLARLEGSKVWMKTLLRDAGVPTAKSFTARSHEQARSQIQLLEKAGCTLFAIKTSYLAEGKGVFVTDNPKLALEDAMSKIDEYPPRPGEDRPTREVVIEAGLVGPEMSQFILPGGPDSAPFIFPSAQDFKKLRDGDTGPNTGGMGAYSPLEAHPLGLTQEEQLDVYKQTTEFLLRYFTDHGMDYRGVLFAGLMLTEAGPQMLEYNIRFGDPESSAIFPRCTGGLGEALYAVARGESFTPPTFSDEVAVCVVLATPGYAETSDLPKGEIITGLDQAEKQEGVTLYYAGVAVNDQGDVVTNGGRVINVVGTGDDLKQARERAYAAAELITWGSEGPHYRTDIGAFATAA